MSRSSERRVRAMVQAAAFALLAKLHDFIPSVSATVADELATVTITIASTGAPTVAPPLLDGLTPAERAVYGALSRRAQTPQALARVAGYSLRTTQNALTVLCRREPPLARRTADGYRLV